MKSYVIIYVKGSACKLFVAVCDSVADLSEELRDGAAGWALSPHPSSQAACRGGFLPPPPPGDDPHEAGRGGACPIRHFPLFRFPVRIPKVRACPVSIPHPTLPQAQSRMRMWKDKWETGTRPVQRGPPRLSSRRDSGCRNHPHWVSKARPGLCRVRVP